MPTYDAFISYSRRNASFADALQNGLERYKPPKGLKAEHRHLKVFRDKQDFTGNEYYQSLDNHLKDSAKLIVVCTPESARSEYVNGEIRRFAELHGSSNIIPVLSDGIPNNEAGPEQQASLAFPPALCDLMAMPLAADYRGFTPGKHKVNRPPYTDPWYTVLANLYQVPRAEIEERDRKRQARTRRITFALVASVMAVIGVTGAVAWRSRLEARERDQAARQLQYIGNIQLAQQAYDATDLPGMRKLLAAAATEYRGYEWSYLSRLSQGPAAITQLDAAAVAVAFSPDATQLATGGADGAVRLWSSETLKQTARLDAKNHKVASLSFSPDGKFLAAALEDAPVMLWDLTQGMAPREIKDLGARVDHVSFSLAAPLLAGISVEDDNGLIKIVRVWDMRSNSITAVMKGDITVSGSSLTAALSPNGETIAFTSGFGVKVCSHPTGDTIAEFDGPGKYIGSLTFSPDGKTLVVSSDEGKLLFFDVPSRRESAVIEAHSAYITSTVFSRDGRYLVTASEDKTIKLWDAASRAARVTWKGHDGGVSGIAISPDGTTVASVSQDKTIRMWAVTGRAEYEEAVDGDVLLTGIEPSAKDGRVALATSSSILIWDSATRKVLARFTDPGPIAAIAFSPDQRTIAIAGSSLELWDIHSGARQKLAGQTAAVNHVAYSPDGKLLASGSADRTVRLWNAETRQPSSAVLTGHGKAVTAVTFSPDGQTIASGSDDGTVRLWAASSGHELASASVVSAPPADFEPEENRLISAIEFSPDSHSLAVSAADGTATVWRAGRTLEKLATLVGHLGPVNDVAFSPDGRTIATAGNDGTVKLWHAGLFRELLTLREPKPNLADMPQFIRGREGRVQAVAFSRDGKALISGLLGGPVRIRRALQ